MNYDYQNTPFSKALLTGVFCGLASTLVSLAYSFVFKLSTGYTLSTVVNVPIIIFFSMIILTVAGLIYHFITQIKGGEALFIGLFILATAFVTWKIFGVERTADRIINIEFRELAGGILLITGACAFFLIPYLYHSRKFEDAIL